MSNVTGQLVYLCGYFVLFVGSILGIWLWQIKRRRERPPLEFKLLRSPGESLRRRMAKAEEHLIVDVGGAALMPIVAGLLTLQLIVWFSPHMRLTYGLVIIAVPVIIALVLSGQYVMRKFTRIRNDALGYLGERVVGEALESLQGDGFRIFHDVPAEVAGMKFNVDHVAVGSNGVFAVETKTRRKGRVRPGFEAHKVAYDGRQLIWPWAEDNFGLKNASDRARWLSDWLNKMTGFGVTAQPVLALPGWYVVPKGVGPIMVVNHKQLPGYISKAAKPFLSDEQIDLIARQLDLLCRDVED